jgi:hypothetical protein
MRFEPATVGSNVPRETFFAVTAEPGVNVLEIPLRFEIDPNSAPGFSVTDPCDWVSTENGGHVCESTISFSPLRVDLQTGTLLFHAGGEIEARRVTMSGDGLAPTFRAFPPPLFDVPSFQSSITLPVFVQADEPLLLSFSIFQNPPLAWLTESVCARWVEGIEGGYICRVNVTYTPPDTGQHGAVLEIRVGELDPVKVEIFGAWTVNP